MYYYILELLNLKSQGVASKTMKRRDRASVHGTSRCCDDL